MYGFKEKNNLLSCNMDRHNTRKELCQKVQLRATLVERNLRISQGRMCWKKIYYTLKQDFASFLKTGVVDSYSLIDCVTIHLQRWKMLSEQVKSLSLFKNRYCWQDKR